MPRASAGQCGVFPCPAACADGLAAALCAQGAPHAGVGAVGLRGRAGFGEHGVMTEAVGCHASHW